MSARRILLVGAGGIGAPAGLALAESARRTGRPLEVVLVDDDRVERSNLHRQILFGERDVGAPKTERLAAELERRGGGALAVRAVEGRATPATIEGLLALEPGVVLDAVDNFATRFLLADACALAGVAIVHAAAVRLHATVLTAAAGGRPCYRCLFEDLPGEGAPDCATAGVLGPVCGVAGAVGADRALALLDGRALGGDLVTYEARGDRLRALRVAARADCPLCGDAPTIRALELDRYVGPSCEV